MTKRDEFISKFDRNARMMKLFLVDYGKFIDIKNCGEAPAFAESDMTNNQYITVLKQVSDIEYSQEQTEAIRKLDIHPNAISDYILNLDKQYNSLKALHDEIKITLDLHE